MHFWPTSALVYGIRIDYLAPTLYFLDLLILLYLFVNWKINTSFKILNSNLEFITPILFLNLLYSQNPLATLSWSLHLLLYLIFLFSISHDLRSTIYKALTVSAFYQLALALTQVILGHSVGGLTYYLGERTVAVGLPSVALASIMGSVVLRAYATFSHPNILAGWAVVSLLILLRLKLSTKYQILGAILVSALVFLTQSRSSAIALFAIIIPFYILKSIRHRLAYLVIAMLLLLVTPQSLVIPSRSDFSLQQRLDLQKLSSQVISQYPLFGTGAQASITTYPSVSPSSRLLQPDHNSATLFLSWFGIFGVFAALHTLSSIFENLRIWDLRFAVPLTPLLLLDHYLLTSPQGLFVLLLYLRLALNYPHAQNHRQQHFRSTRRQVL